MGIIDIIAPVKAEMYYRLKRYPYFVEFYLLSHSAGKSIMTTLLPMVVNELAKQGINGLSAVANRQNIAAGKVLNRSGFKISKAFDHLQDLYEINAA